jgi:hypothetical protein
MRETKILMQKKKTRRKQTKERRSKKGAINGPT